MTMYGAWTPSGEKDRRPSGPSARLRVHAGSASNRLPPTTDLTGRPSPSVTRFMTASERRNRVFCAILLVMRQMHSAAALSCGRLAPATKHGSWAALAVADEPCVVPPGCRYFLRSL